MSTEILLEILNSDSILVLIMLIIISSIFSFFHIKSLNSNQLVNLNVVDDEMVIKKIYTIKCQRCKEFIYDADICYDNITKYPYHKKCLDVFDYNTEKLHQPT